MTFKLPKPPQQVLIEVGAAVAVVACLAVAIWWGLHDGQRNATEAVTQHAAAVTADAGTSAARDAVKVVVDNGRVADAIRELHDENAASIRSAPGATDQLDPALAAAAVRSLCRYESQRHDPACAPLLQPDP